MGRIRVGGRPSSPTIQASVVWAGSSTFGPFDLSTLFRTPDQQAQRMFDRGAYVQAAELFCDPMRRGTAWYRAGDFKRAATAFGRDDSAEGWFNRGNALLMQGDYMKAIASYERALKERLGWERAQANLRLATARLEKLKPPDDQVSQKGMGEDDEPDEIVFDERAKKLEQANTETIQAGEELSDEALRALWLRRVESSPADFLRRKFAYQYGRRSSDP